MSLKGRLGEAVLNRITAIPAVKAEMGRAERREPVLRAARAAASSSLDDEQAKAKLHKDLDADATVVEDALGLLDRQRGYSYIEDRAYRLLAAAAGTAVAPIQPEHAELFAEESSIGRMPIERAFQRLAEQQARTANPSNDQRESAVLEHIDQSVRLLARRSDHELLRTALTANIARRYLYEVAENTRSGAPEKAYFDDPNGMFVDTGANAPQRTEY